MSEMSTDDFFRRQAQDAHGPESPGRDSGARVRRRLRRVALAAGVGLTLVVGVAVGGTYLTANHLASSVQRMHGIVALEAANQPVMPAATRKSMTILLTSSGTRPGPNGGGTDGASPQPTGLSGLIALVHLNANDAGGAVVSIPANTLVKIPGHGTRTLWSALSLGGPSLLIRTVEHLTNVRISHYAVLDFPNVRNVIGAMDGVNVDVPVTVHSGRGFIFPAGINHLTRASVLAYARQLHVSQVGRSELQSNLMRAMLHKIASKHLLVHASLDYRLLDAVAHAFSVDSSFSDAHLMALVLRLGDLSGGHGTFITTPTTDSGSTAPVVLRQPYARRLWSAVRHDSVAAYAKRYPFTVTPGAPR